MSSEWCLDCGAPLGELWEGDVAMCTCCGSWHEVSAEQIKVVTEKRVGELAREKMDPYEVLAALQRNADAMLGIFHGRRAA